MKILIIDDEIEICLHIKDIFGFEGYEAEFATTAKEGLQKIGQATYNLILVDIKLGGMTSGVDIIKVFRAKVKRPKIMVISAIPLDALTPIFIKEGMRNLIDGFLDKPSGCDPEKLIAATKKMLG